MFSLSDAQCFTGVAKVVGIGDRLPYLTCSIQWLCVANLPHNVVNPCDGLLSPCFSQNGQLIVHQIGKEICDKFLKISSCSRGYRPILGSHS